MCTYIYKLNRFFYCSTLVLCAINKLFCIISRVGRVTRRVQCLTNHDVTDLALGNVLMEARICTFLPKAEQSVTSQ